MLKIQLSRVPLARKLFQPALWALQQPHKNLHSLQLAIDTELVQHYCCNMLYELLVQEDFFKVHQSTKMALERATSHIKVTHRPGLFQLLPLEIKQISNANFLVAM